MYISMCIKDIGEIKKGHFFDTYQKSAVPYVYIRPEMSEDEYTKIPEADYFHSFTYVGDCLLLEMKTLYQEKKLKFFKWETVIREARQTGYYKFDELNRELLREVQRQIYLPVKQLEKYKFAYNSGSFELIDQTLENLSLFCEMDLPKKKLLEEIAAAAKVINDEIEKAKERLNNVLHEQRA